MRLALIFGFIFISGAAMSQSIEFSSGYILNKFYSMDGDNPHYRSDFKSGPGYSLAFGFEDYVDGRWKIRLTLAFDNYRGDMDVSIGGLGGGGNTKASISKSVISLGAYPLVFKVKKKLDLNFGFEISGFLYENIEGVRSGWNLTNPMGSSYDINEEYERYSEIITFGVKARIAYDINLSESLILSPQYAFYLGLAGEFKYSPTSTGSMRHYFGIGLEKKIRQKKNKGK